MHSTNVMKCIVWINCFWREIGNCVWPGEFVTSYEYSLASTLNFLEWSHLTTLRRFLSWLLHYIFRPNYLGQTVLISLASYVWFHEDFRRFLFRFNECKPALVRSFYRYPLYRWRKCFHFHAKVFPAQDTGYELLLQISPESCWLLDFIALFAVHSCRTNCKLMEIGQINFGFSVIRSSKIGWFLSNQIWSERNHPILDLIGKKVDQISFQSDLIIDSQTQTIHNIFHNTEYFPWWQWDNTQGAVKRNVHSMTRKQSIGSRAKDQFLLCSSLWIMEGPLP